MKLNKEGFITQFLVSGPKTEPYINENTDTNQLRYEKNLRSLIVEHSDESKMGEVVLHTNSELGMPWEYYFSYGNWFVDKSSFYSNLVSVELVAAVNLEVLQDMEVTACLWSYGAVDVWLNDKKVGMMETPVYKPIAKQTMLLKLNKGENQLYIKLQNLGVRDTRNIFGIQIEERQDEIKVTVPDKEQAKPYIEAEEWLKQITLQGHTLHFASPAFAGTSLGYDSASPDVTLGDSRIEWFDISQKSCVELEKNRPFVTIAVLVNGSRLTRRFEILEDIQPIYLKKNTHDANMQEVYERISDVKKLDRGEDIGFSLANILARIEVGRFLEEDTANIYETLDQIESRIDCADFMLCALVRYLHTNSIDEVMEQRVKEVLLGFRYWMDQEGSDAMCFWSENHSLMFYTCGMNAGERYPDEIFTRSGMTGKELYEVSRRKVMEWLTDVETYGFEEFLSGVYMCITFIALLNVIDYSEEEISQRAKKIADKLFFMVSLHAFQGSVIAPQGRVYRDVLYPYEQGLQSLVNLLNYNYPYSYGEGWLGFFASSKYKIPFELVSLMESEVKTEYASGNALIRLNKTKHYAMTSIQSPREDKEFARWENISLGDDCDVNSHEFIKSLNERFHGTTCFEPGVYGYQQHLWTAALAPTAIVFANHPGGPCDESSMRPGYWFGNGVFPAIKQEGNAIAAIYVIPEEHPIDFTHVHFAKIRYEEVLRQDSWLLGKKGEGYVGIWSSGLMEEYNDQLFDVEYRVYGRETAYLCICSDSKECETMEQFVTLCQSYAPVFDQEKKVLHTEKNLVLAHQKREDKTQII